MKDPVIQDRLMHPFMLLVSFMCSFVHYRLFTHLFMLFRCFTHPFMHIGSFHATVHETSTPLMKSFAACRFVHDL